MFGIRHQTFEPKNLSVRHPASEISGEISPEEIGRRITGAIGAGKSGEEGRLIRRQVPEVAAAAGGQFDSMLISVKPKRTCPPLYRSDFWNSFSKPRYRALPLLFWLPEKSLRDPISQFKEGISKIALIFFLSLPRSSFMPKLIKQGHLYLGKNHTGFDFTLYSL